MCRFKFSCSSTPLSGFIPRCPGVGPEYQKKKKTRVCIPRTPHLCLIAAAAYACGKDTFFSEIRKFLKNFFKKLRFFEIVFEKVSIFRKRSENEIFPLGAGHDILIIELRFQQTWFRNFFLEGTCSTDVSRRFYNCVSRGHCAIIVVLQVITRRLNGWLRADRCQTQSP